MVFNIYEQSPICLYSFMRPNTLDSLGNQEEKMSWIVDQFENCNLLTILIMIIFVTSMSKANTMKQLKAQSEEIYKEFEEVKDEIRGQHTSIAQLINARTK
jgi:hypothetical protein